MNQTLKDWLAMGRVANLPSVVSNVTAGALLGMIAEETVKQKHFLLLGLIACCLYLAGCYLNDWWDRKWDLQHKPDRPTVTGRVNTTILLTVTICLFAIAIIGSIAVNTPSLIVTLIVISLILFYSAIHKLTPLGIIPMGLCRSGLYALGFVGEGSHLFDTILEMITDHSNLPILLAALIAPLLGLACYIAGISLLARSEAQPFVPRINRVIAIGLMALPVMTQTCSIIMAEQSAKFLVLTLPFLVVLIMALALIKKNISKGVSLLLANICWLDFILVASLFWFRFEDLQEFHLLNTYIIYPLIPVVAFSLSLLLQRLAPAT